MDRAPVSSSNIRSIGYDAESSILEIEFHTSAVYQYYGVGQGEYDALMSAQSHGAFFNANIKGRYAFAKI